MIEWTGQFKRDYKREIKGKYRLTIKNDLSLVIEMLANEQALEIRYHDHALTGDWKDCRDCHIKPDLVLIYRKYYDILQLIRLGFHSELGL